MVSRKMVVFPIITPYLQDTSIEALRYLTLSEVSWESVSKSLKDLLLLKHWGTKRRLIWNLYTHTVRGSVKNNLLSREMLRGAQASIPQPSVLVETYSPGCGRWKAPSLPRPWRLTHKWVGSPLKLNLSCVVHIFPSRTAYTQQHLNSPQVSYLVCDAMVKY